LAEERTSTLSSNIDTLANEIFARLNDENCNDAVEDPQLYLTRVTSTLVRPSGAEQEVIHAALQGLPSSQREAMLLHLGGLTCAQIAHRHGKTHQAVLKDLTSA
jgi:DNA-directed RNA polymerase specialized sigma24 family protein